ncbi:lipopolysaccharide assembly protein LapB [Brumicola blandensis]|jgi:lipopolysaccharide biosynthesis regulator YciM|uniref:Lipopolysaccharide assembly protein B n=1 Tax=Brumicola blandensis TaxID=3075611 RepID=A0AAW8QWP3_9ALTE|nr:lipopolysaccharide assembly protein LapB [Alteromonas sp. W409]MDT0581416.1 lipopolysaccharide assembly protein LapB [Alteromonas sp. W409]
MLEALFLALPVAVAYGWVMGRNSLRKAQRKQSSILSKHYYKGLNFLLSDEPDKAVDTLMKMISVNNDTVETHIAMGNFFRHRGELDRAIRVHQNLISRDEISSRQEALALVELGTDYLMAGFLERAEGVFLQLLEQTQHFDLAQQKLFNIYQITKEWNKAIDLASASIQITPNDKHLYVLLSHFYCEQAKLLLEDENVDEARSFLKKAIVIDGSQVRAWLDLGRLALESGNYKEAFNYLSEIPKRDLDWLSEAVPLLEEWAAKCDGWEELDKLLEPYWQKCASSYIAKVNIIAKRGENNLAIDTLNTQLQKHPTMRGFKTLLSLYQEDFKESEQAQRSIEHLKSLLDKQIGQRPKYRCHSCGFSGRQLHWLCPSCKTWSSNKPIKGLDGE